MKKLKAALIALALSNLPRPEIKLRNNLRIVPDQPKSRNSGVAAARRAAKRRKAKK